MLIMKAGVQAVGPYSSKSNVAAAISLYNRNIEHIPPFLGTS